MFKRCARLLVRTLRDISMRFVGVIGMIFALVGVVPAHWCAGMVARDDARSCCAPLPADGIAAPQCACEGGHTCEITARDEAVPTSADAGAYAPVLPATEFVPAFLLTAPVAHALATRAPHGLPPPNLTSVTSVVLLI